MSTLGTPGSEEWVDTIPHGAGWGNGG